mmetsp:Transcript_4152/g.16109  ORF Transcript_4152/g.16109 Transcript_4152/m.16109 type:complete len:347 (+) Transcript_4152:1987-3027(+)
MHACPPSGSLAKLVDDVEHLKRRSSREARWNCEGSLWQALEEGLPDLVLLLQGLEQVLAVIPCAELGKRIEADAEAWAQARSEPDLGAEISSQSRVGAQIHPGALRQLQAGDLGERLPLRNVGALLTAKLPYGSCGQRHHGSSADLRVLVKKLLPQQRHDGFVDFLHGSLGRAELAALVAACKPYQAAGQCAAHSDLAVGGDFRCRRKESLHQLHPPGLELVFVDVSILIHGELREHPREGRQIGNRARPHFRRSILQQRGQQVNHHRAPVAAQTPTQNMAFLGYRGAHCPGNILRESGRNWQQLAPQQMHFPPIYGDGLRAELEANIRQRPKGRACAKPFPSCGL